MARVTADRAVVRIRLEEHEADLVRSLLEEMRTLLEAEIPRSDAVMTRLFPAAYEEEDDERAYRDMTGDELHAHKLRALEAIAEQLGAYGPLDARIGADGAATWLALLADLRLAIGTRLDVTEESMAHPLDKGDPDAAAYSVLHWLGWVQESLLDVLERLQRGGRDGRTQGG